MKSSLFLAGAGALLASASPIDFAKRALVMEYFTVTETVTEYFGEESKVEATGGVFVEQPAPVETVTSTVDTQPSQPARKEQKKSSSSSDVVFITTTIQPVQPTKSAAPAESEEAKEEPKASTTKKEEPKTTLKTEAAKATNNDWNDKTNPIPLTDYKFAMLEHHNIHRRNHSAPDLVWNQELADAAKVTSESCKWGHQMNINGLSYGQNLARWGSSSVEEMADRKIKTAAQGVTNQWYNGELPLWGKTYGGADVPSGVEFHDVGHFTQLVWVNTQEVGCYTSHCETVTDADSGEVTTIPQYYTTCNYNEPGNVGKGYGKNVKKPLGNPTYEV